MSSPFNPATTSSDATTPASGAFSASDWSDAEPYHLLFEMAEDGVVLHELTSETNRGRFIMVNDAFCALLGYSREEMLGMGVFDIVAAEDMDSVPEEREHLLQDGRLRFEQKLVTKDGRRLVAEIRTTIFEKQGKTLVFSIVRDVTERAATETTKTAIVESNDDAIMGKTLDGTGRVVGTSEIARDITASKRAEAELRAVLTNSRCILWRADVWDDNFAARESPDYQPALRWDTRVQDEHAAQQVLPLERHGQEYSWAWAASRQVEDRSRINENALRAILEGAPGYAHEFRCTDKFGRLVWLREEANIVPLEPGRWQLFGVATDVTERKLADEKVRESEQNLRLALDAAQLGTWRHDLLSGLIHLDERAQVHYGAGPVVPIAEIVARLHAEDRDAVGAAMGEALDPITGTGRHSIDYRVVYADGTVRWLRIEARVHFEGEGADRRAVNGFGTSQDISERKSIEEEFRVTNERFSAALKASPVVMFNQDRELRYTWIHNSARGNSADTVLGKLDSDLFDRPEDAAVAENIKRRVLESGRGERAQIAVHFQGIPHHYDLTVEPLRDAAGHITGVTCVAVDITAQQQLQDDLRRQARLLDEAHDAIFAWELDGTIVYWNQGAQRLYGFRSDFALGKISHELLQTSNSEERKGILTALQRDGVWTGELEHTGHDGQRIAVASRQRLVQEADGRSLVVEANRDITFRKRAEAELKESEARFRHVSETVSDYAYELRLLPDDSMALAWFTDALPKIIGVTPDELKKINSWQQFLHSDDLAVAAQHLNEILAGRSSVADFRIVGKDGSARWVRDFARPMLDETGQTIGVQGGAQEITERKKNESATRFLVEASGVLAASLDYETTLQHIVRLCVPELADWCMVHLADGEAPFHAVAHADPQKAEVAREFHRLFPPDLQRDNVRMAEIRAGRSVLAATVTPEEIAAWVPEPERYALLQRLNVRSILMVPLLSDGRAIGLLLLGITESERRYDEQDLALAEELARRASVAIERGRLFREAHAAREAAESANRTKDEFLSVVSHELRTPLTPILGWVDILRHTDEASVKAHALDVLERNVHAQVQLVNDILDVSRITTGKLRVELKSAALEAPVNEAVESVLPAAIAKGVRLVVSSQGEVRALCDTARLRQVVWNLLSNAVRFTPAGGKVEITLRQTVKQAEIEVSDTGLGIHPDFLPHVFERFRQADSSHTRAHGGLGLGLSIVRHIVEMHGGDVSVASDGEGCGTTFTVRLPLAP